MLSVTVGEGYHVGVVVAVENELSRGLRMITGEFGFEDEPERREDALLIPPAYPPYPYRWWSSSSGGYSSSNALSSTASSQSKWGRGDVRPRVPEWRLAVWL